MFLIYVFVFSVASMVICIISSIIYNGGVVFKQNP